MLGIGQALIDYAVCIDDPALLESLGVSKGGRR